jgi:hypothetical protein
MVKHAERTAKKNYTAVALAEDVDLARDYVEMLRNNEIPARFVVNNELVQGSRVGILVPEELIEQAQCLIQARCSGPDFYDYIYGDDLADKIDETED